MNNPASRQQWIYDLLCSEPNSLYVDVWAKYGQKWAKGKTTFDKDWKTAKERHQDYQNKLQKEKEAISIVEDLKPLKEGLKTKNERLLFYQNEVDKIEMQLRGEVEFTWLNQGKVQPSHSDGVFILPVQVQNDLRRVIKEYQGEISKIEGDYAPKRIDAKVEASGVDFFTLEE